MATKKKKVLTTEDIERNALIDSISLKLYNRTLKFVGKYYDPPEGTPCDEARAQYVKYAPIIEAVQNGDWGCQEQNVMDLVTSLVQVLGGVDISEHLTGNNDDSSIPDSDWRQGVVLVPVNCTNSHDYTIGKPAMIRENGSSNNCFAMDNKDHNCLDDSINSLRLPTLDEVKMIVTKHFDEVTEMFIIL